MMRYAQIDENGLCIGVSDLSNPVSAQNMIAIGPTENPIGSTWDGEDWTVPAPTPPAPVRIDTPLFIMRFTPQERVAMRQAAKSDSEYAPLIDDWLAILNDPRLAYVELGDPNLVAAMGMMVSLGLLTQQRADIVMTP